jgi:hypothetical protein
MKEIREIKMVEQVSVKFVADDGKEFVGENAERDCRDYERTRDEKKVKEAFERLDATKIYMPTVNWHCDAAETWKVVLNSKRDYIAMTDYFKEVLGCYDNYTEAPKEYPYTMIVMRGWECFDEYGCDIKVELQKVLEQLG